MNTFLEKIKNCFNKSDVSIDSLFKFNVASVFFMVIAITSKVMYFHYTSGLSKGSLWSNYNYRVLIATVGTVLIIHGIASIFFRKNLFKSSIFINVFLSVLLFADTVYYRYYFNAITVPVLYQLGLAGSIGESIKSLIKVSDFIFTVDVPVLVVGFFLSKTIKKHIRNISADKSLKHFRFRNLPSIVMAIILITSGFFVFGSSRGNAAKGIFIYDNNYVINNLGILYFHKYDVERFFRENVFTDRKLTASEKEKVDDFYNKKALQVSNMDSTSKKYTGAAAGKNVIIVQTEALQQFVINRKLNGKEITPNLNKLMTEAAYFDNFYYQTGGGNTADAEFLSNNSLYPMKEGAVYFRFPYNKYHSLPKALKEEGYQTYVIHANNPSFWNRTEMYKAVGFDTFYSAEDFKTDEIVGWGLSDKSMFRQALQKIDTKKPFYSFFITLSSHHPFANFENYSGFDSREFNKTFVGNYLKAANYADMALGSLIDELKQKGLYDNSILVIYGDHFGIQKDQKLDFEKLLGHKIDTREWTMLQKTPCFIHYPGMKQTGKIDTIGGEIDVMPTVANLLGINVPYAFGKDLFNCGEGYAVLRNSSVITPDYTYINENNSVYDSKGNLIGSNKSSNKMYNYKDMQKALNISEIILKKDYFRTIEGTK